MLQRLKQFPLSLAKRPIMGAAILASALSSGYWLLMASDRYVSQAHVIIQRTDVSAAQSVDFASLLGASNGASRGDQLLLREHLLSLDMLGKLDAQLDLRRHYSDTRRDPLSRLWAADASLEKFYRHHLSRVSVELDDYAGVLRIQAQGYDPKAAQAIVQLLVAEGERFMNEMAHELAQDQVTFLQKQVTVLGERALQARQAVLRYQDAKGLVSPQAAAENLGAIVSKLEAQRSELQTERTALSAYLVPQHPRIVQIGQQIAAIDKQLAQEQAKLAAPKGRQLNRTIEEFQRLEMEAEFAQTVYKTALVALEKGQIEATRNIKKVSVLQAPSLPQYPLEPRRLYNTLVSLLLAALLAGVAHLLAAIVRDHKD